MNNYLSYWRKLGYKTHSCCCTYLFITWWYIYPAHKSPLYQWTILHCVVIKRAGFCRCYLLQQMVLHWHSRPNTWEAENICTRHRCLVLSSILAVNDIWEPLIYLLCTLSQGRAAIFLPIAEQFQNFCSGVDVFMANMVNYIIKSLLTEV